MTSPPSIPSFAQADIARILITPDEIQAKIAAWGEAISRDYAGLSPVLVGILKGSVFVLADLLRHITIPVRLDFIAISSYGPQTRHSGVVRLLKDLDHSIEGCHVLVVEDIIDTGLTLSYVLRQLRQRRPASLAVGTLLNKPVRRLVDIPLRYVGFELPDEFVVGYGLDFRGRYRNLPFIATLRPEILLAA
jgi:hypoxanthine phosphoribosyltransferase